MFVGFDFLRPVSGTGRAASVPRCRTRGSHAVSSALCLFTAGWSAFVINPRLERTFGPDRK